MTNVTEESTIKKIQTLLESYSFDTNQCNIEFLIYDWLKDYKIEWIYLATIEALYLGRYKVVSIKQILTIWQRLDTPKTHFSGDFARFISRNLPKHTHSNSNDIATPKSQKEQVKTHQKITITNDLSAVNNSQTSDSYSLVANSHADLITSVNKQDFSNKKVSQPQVHSCPKPHDEFGFVQTSAIFDKYQNNGRDTSLNPNDGIKSFSPNPDFSKFFQKLKSFADSQNQIK